LKPPGAEEHGRTAILINTTTPEKGLEFKINTGKGGAAGRVLAGLLLSRGRFLKRSIGSFAREKGPKVEYKLIFGPAAKPRKIFDCQEE
jgi:hypothetical protein